MRSSEPKPEARAEMLAGVLLRLAYLARDSTDWDDIVERIAGLQKAELKQLVRDTIAEELRTMRARLKAGENVLNELDRKLVG